MKALWGRAPGSKGRGRAESQSPRSRTNLSQGRVRLKGGFLSSNSPLKTNPALQPQSARARRMRGYERVSHSASVPSSATARVTSGRCPFPSPVCVSIAAASGPCRSADPSPVVSAFVSRRPGQDLPRPSLVQEGSLFPRPVALPFAFCTFCPLREPRKARCAPRSAYAL